MGGFRVCYMCQGLNSHYFHIIGAGHRVINPIVGVYIPIIRIPIKGGMTIPNIATFDHSTYNYFPFLWFVEGDCLLCTMGLITIIHHHLGEYFWITFSRHRGWLQIQVLGDVLNYCWWFRNPANQLRLVLYPIIFRVLFPSQVVGNGISEASTASPPFKGPEIHGKSTRQEHIFAQNRQQASPAPVSWCEIYSPNKKGGGTGRVAREYQTSMGKIKLPGGKSNVQRVNHHVFVPSIWEIWLFFSNHFKQSQI